MDNDYVLKFSGRIRSVECALTGIWVMVRSQQNAWVHAVATSLVILVGLRYGLTVSEWCWMVAAVTSVWAVEAMNTAFEFLTDAACPDFHPLAGKAKDIAAGSVLLTAIGSLVIGLLVLGPYLMADVNTFLAVDLELIVGDFG